MGKATSNLAHGSGEDSRPSRQLQAGLGQQLGEYSNDCKLLGCKRGHVCPLQPEGLKSREKLSQEKKRKKKKAVFS